MNQRNWKRGNSLRFFLTVQKFARQWQELKFTPPLAATALGGSYLETVKNRLCIAQTAAGDCLEIMPRTKSAKTGTLTHRLFAGMEVVISTNLSHLSAGMAGTSEGTRKHGSMAIKILSIHKKNKNDSKQILYWQLGVRHRARQT